MRGRLATFAFCLAGGCASPQVTLLPGEEGHPVGAVALLNEDGSERGLLDSANSQVALRGPSARARPVPQKRLDRRYGALVADLPPPAVHFVLTFDIGMAQPTAEQETTLRAILRTVADRPGAEVQVVGHTDTLDSDEVNDRLSQRRAGEVRDYLIQRGIPADQVRATWRGERELAVATADGVANETNRRVEIIIR
jgi:outer membrane protein OmpA-like peptidoglycan-associated protein